MKHCTAWLCCFGGKDVYLQAWRARSSAGMEGRVICRHGHLQARSPAELFPVCLVEVLLFLSLVFFGSMFFHISLLSPLLMVHITYK